MKKNYFVFIIALVYGNFLDAQIVDNLIDDPGDIAFVGYHNSIDGFSFVFLDNCPIGATIRFVDEEWNGSAFESESNEGEVLWTNTSGGVIAQGTVIHIQNADDAISISASVGTAIEDDNGFGISSTNDGIIAITGTRTSPGVFLAFFGDTTDSSLTGTSLINGSTANQQASYGTGYYSGATSCDGLTITQCAERINNVSNWTIAPTFTYPGDVMSNLEVSGVLSDNTRKNDSEFFCYPNSKGDRITIVSDIKIQVVRVYDSLGMELLCLKKTHEKIEIDFRNFAKGVYVIACETRSSKGTKLIVKR